MKKKKKNIFVRAICAVGRGIEFVFLYLVYLLLYAIIRPLTICKLRGKENINEGDEARVFVCNHYEMYGPMAMFLNFPYKFRPWIIDKMMEKDKIEVQMSIMIYNNYKRFPKWFKKLVIKCVRNLMVFVMHHAKGISVSHDNPRKNIEAFEISSKEMQKNKAIVIFPEVLYQKQGVGEFQSGFANLAKFHYKKTGKKITFYPIFISQKNKEMYVGVPLTFNPENEQNDEKQQIVSTLRSEMIKLYEEFEVNAKQKKSKKKQKENNKN